MPGPDASPFSRYIVPLDGIRAVAVGMVLLHHVSYGYVPGGFLGVDLFFVLSGFLITGLLVREYSESGSIRLDLFYERRLYRILPPVLVLLVLVSVFYSWLKVSDYWEQDYWTSVLSVLFFLANLVPGGLGPLVATWSLAIEEQFYLIWPVVLIFHLNRVWWRARLIPLLLSVLMFGSLLRTWLWLLGVNPWFLYRFTPTRLDGLLLGGIAALVVDGVLVRQVIRRLSDFRVPESILFSLVALLPGFRRTAAFLYWGGFAVFAFLFAILVLCIVNETQKRWYLSMLVSAPLVWLGKRSYGIYLYHLPIFSLLEPLRTLHSVGNFVLISILRIAVVLVFAELSYRWIETPILRRKAALNWKQSKARK